MNWVQIINTAVGAFLGFLSGLIIYWLKTRAGLSKQRKNAIKNLRYELEYNLGLCEEFKGKVSETIETVNSENHSVYLTLDYEFIGSYFAKQFYNGGYLSEFLHQDDMKKWNVFLSRLSAGSEAHIEETLEQWRKFKIDKETVVTSLNLERKDIEFAKEMTEYLLQKIML